MTYTTREAAMKAALKAQGQIDAIIKKWEEDHPDSEWEIFTHIDEESIDYITRWGKVELWVTEKRDTEGTKEAEEPPSSDGSFTFDYPDGYTDTYGGGWNDGTYWGVEVAFFFEWYED